MIETITRALVDQPDAVFVSEINRLYISIIELHVAKKDIGKQDRTADALRTFLNAVSTKAKTRSLLEIID